MPNLNEIKRQIAACPGRYIFWTQKEIRALPQILDKSETIRAVTSGYMNNSTWLGLCTNRRLIFLNCGMFLGLRQIQMPLDRVQSIDHQFTLFFGSIRVFDGINHVTLTMVQKASILPFVKTTEETMYAFNRASVAKPTPPQSIDIASQLTKLAELREKGHLTEEEFQTQKKKLLAN